MTFDRRLQRYLRGSAARGRDVVRAGPFTAYLDPHDALRFLNYAIPEEGTAPTPEDAVELAQALAARDRLARLEYVESEAPGLASVLEAAGYAREATLDLMTCTPATLRRAPGEPDGLRFEIVEPGAAGDLPRRLRSVQHAAFEHEGGDAPSRHPGLLATLDGRDVAGGAFTVPDDGLSEVAGIGTLPEFRRRGIAAALTTALAAEAFERGVEITFLTPGDDGTRRVYERAGFRTTSTVLAYTQEAHP